MSDSAQRFCPVCGIAFSIGEAVLQCSGCHAAHHPNYWIEHGGCATVGEHEGQPLPVPFGDSRSRQPAPHADHGEADSPPPIIPAPEDRDDDPDFDEPPTVGGLSARPGRRRQGPHPDRARAAPPARRLRNPGTLGAPTQRLPRTYGGQGLLRYWFVPAGAVLALGIAFGIVWGVDQLRSGDDGEPAVALETATPTAAASATLVSAPTSPPPETPGVTATATPAPRFAPGDGAVVEGTGSCLNVRAEASLEADVVDCIADGTGVTVLAGPVDVDDISWWRVEAPNVNGWAAEIYLATP